MPRRLQWVQVTWSAEAFDRRDRFTRYCRNRRDAGFYGGPINMHGASPTQTGTATKLWGSSRLANVGVYIFVIMLGLIVWKDPGFVSSVETQLKQGKSVQHIAIEELKTLFR